MSPIPKTSQDQFLGLDFSYSKTTLVNTISADVRIFLAIIFRPEMLKFHPYSILTGEAMVAFVLYCVLNESAKVAGGSRLQIFCLISLGIVKYTKSKLIVLSGINSTVEIRMIYQVIVSPKMPPKNFSDFCPTL